MLDGHTSSAPGAKHSGHTTAPGASDTFPGIGTVCSSCCTERSHAKKTRSVEALIGVAAAVRRLSITRLCATDTQNSETGRLGRKSREFTAKAKSRTFRVTADANGGFYGSDAVKLALNTRWARNIQQK